MAPLTFQYNELADVAQDLDLVVQSTTGDEWQWQAGAAESSKWNEFVAGNGHATTNLHGLSGRVSISQNLSLVFTLSSYAAPVSAIVEVSAPTLAPAYVNDLREALVTRSAEWEDQAVSTLFFFETVTAAQAFMADHPVSSTQNGEEQIEQSNGSNEKSDGHQQIENTEIRLARAIFWSHHLKAPSKLKDFNNWCPELDLWGILLVGWPGYLCFEGPKESVDEMIRRVKRLQWHAIQLRLEEDWTYKPDTKEAAEQGGTLLSEAILSCPFAQAHPSNTLAPDSNSAAGKVRTGCQVLTELGDMVHRLRACGMEEEVVTQVLGLRIRKEQ